MSIRTVLRIALLGVVCQLHMDGMAQPEKTRVVLYKDRVNAAFDTVDCVKNVFKINPLLFFRGEIPLYYERALTPRLSLEVGVGVTLRNYLALSLVGDDADDFGAGTEIIPNPSFHIAARYYHITDLEPQGWYTQVEFAHLMYTKDIRMKGPTGEFTEGKLRDERTYNDIRLLLGHQMLSASSNWLFDLYGGVAFRSRHSEKVNETLLAGSSPRVYTYSITEEDDSVPALFLGVKLGLGF
ncbi:MAG: hypothetical protein R2815_07875 [Flavobacteriales bacterium]